MEATLRVSSVTVSNLNQRKQKSTNEYSSVQNISCCRPVICCALYLPVSTLFKIQSILFKKFLFCDILKCNQTTVILMRLLKCNQTSYYDVTFEMKSNQLFCFCVNTDSSGKARSKHWMKCSNVNKLSVEPNNDLSTYCISLFVQYIVEVNIKCFLLFFFLPRCFPWRIYSVHLRDSIWEKPLIINLFEKVIQSSIIWSASKLVHSKRKLRAGIY